MSDQKYISNVELISLLNEATDQELRSLTSIIKGRKYREETPNLSPTAICQNLFEKGGYLKAVNQVAGKLKASNRLKEYSSLQEMDEFEKLTINISKAIKKNLKYTADCEEKIIVKVLELTYENMSEEDKLKFDRSVQEVASRYGKSAKGLVGAAGLMVVANMGGFATYTLMSSLLSALSFGSFGFGAYTTASTLLSTLIGPVGWAGLVVYTLYKLGQPDYKVLIPAVATIGSIRQRVKYEAQRSGGEARTTSDQKGCFIATAVYGDFNAPEVISLRRWRDQVLSTTILGRVLINLYYCLSPPIARHLSSSPWLSAQIRKVLDSFIRRYG